MQRFTVTRVIKRETLSSGWLGECFSHSGSKTILVNGDLSVSRGDQIFCDLGKSKRSNGIEYFEAERVTSQAALMLSSLPNGMQLNKILGEFPELENALESQGYGDQTVEFSGGVFASKYTRIKNSSAVELVDRHQGTLAALRSPIKFSTNPRSSLAADRQAPLADPSGWKLEDNNGGAQILKFGSELRMPGKNGDPSKVLYRIDFAEGKFTPFVFAQAAGGPGICASTHPKNVEIFQFFVDAHEYGHSLDPNFSKLDLKSSDYDYRKTETFADAFAVVETINRFGEAALSDVERIVENREANLVGVMLDQNGALSMPKENRYMTGMSARAALDVMKKHLKDPKLTDKDLSAEDAYAIARKCSNKNTITDKGVQKLFGALKGEVSLSARMVKAFKNIELSKEGIGKFGRDVWEAVRDRDLVSTSDLKNALSKVARQPSLLGRHSKQCLELRRKGNFVLASELTEKQGERLANIFNQDIDTVIKAADDGKFEYSSLAFMLINSQRHFSGTANHHLASLNDEINATLYKKADQTVVDVPLDDGILRNLAEDPYQSKLWGMGNDAKLSSFNSLIEKAHELSVAEHAKPETGFSRFSEFRATMRAILTDIEPLLIDKQGGGTALDSANVSVVGKMALAKKLRAIRDLDPQDINFPLNQKEMSLFRGIAKAFHSQHTFGKPAIQKPASPSNDNTSSESYGMRMF